MKNLLLLFLLVGCVHQSHQMDFHCEGEAFHLPVHELSGQNEKYIRHSGPQKFDNYISLNLNFLNIQMLFDEINKKNPGLKNRGEAHVTVITPVEYDDVLKEKLSIEEIDALADKNHLQSFKLKPVCVGKGEKPNLGATYFIVLESKEIIQFRRQVFAAFVAKGGSASHFDPENFYPHVTVGFSLRDLHESDGVRKGKNSCIANLTLSEK